MHHLSIAATVKSFLPEIGVERHFAGEVPSALFISCDDNATIRPAIEPMTLGRRVL
jgi:hypothetical protein